MNQFHLIVPVAMPITTMTNHGEHANIGELRKSFPLHEETRERLVKTIECDIRNEVRLHTYNGHNYRNAHLCHVQLIAIIFWRIFESSTIFVLHNAHTIWNQGNPMGQRDATQQNTIQTITFSSTVSNCTNQNFACNLFIMSLLNISN